MKFLEAIEGNALYKHFHDRLKAIEAKLEIVVEPEPVDLGLEPTTPEVPVPPKE